MHLAQDVAITNARIVVGNGNVIERGTIVVRRGQIQSVGAAPASVTGLRTIDANGMTAMPGFVDAHRHINTGPDEKAQMQALLEAGYTTVLSGGGPADATPAATGVACALARRCPESAHPLRGGVFGALHTHKRFSHVPC